MVKIGFDKQCITPKLPVALSGYAGKRIAAGVHDELYVRCIAMECSGELYLLAQCDCLAVDDVLRNAVLTRLNEPHLSDAHFVLMATHTHSGPAGTIDTSQKPFTGLTDVFGVSDPAYQKELSEKITLAAHNAFSDLMECQLTVGRGSIENVGTERHDASLPGDSSLLVLRFDRCDGKQVLLYNYACHPTVLNPSNLLITADLPYAVERGFAYDMVMFVNSNAGDISTRFTRKSSSYEQVESYSHVIIEEIRKALEQPVYQGAFWQIDIQQYPIVLPIKKVPPVETAQAQLQKYEADLEKGKQQGLEAKELRILASYVEGASVAVGLSKTLKDLDYIDAHFSIITLQDLKIEVIPGELFSTLGTILKREGIEVFGYGNGYYMYLADKNAYDSMYYEAMSSPFERGVGEYMIREILDKAKGCS